MELARDIHQEDRTAERVHNFLLRSNCRDHPVRITHGIRIVKRNEAQGRGTEKRPLPAVIACLLYS